jgi:uncharacterized protein YciI
MHWMGPPTSRAVSEKPRASPAPLPGVTRLGLTLLGVVLAACGGAQHARAPDCSSPASLLGPERAYLVVFRPAAKWPADAALPKPPLEEHSRYLLSLYRAGTLKVAGRFGDRTGGAMLIEARDDAEALALVEADPAVQHDVYDFDMRPWLLADWAERDLTWPK